MNYVIADIHGCYPEFLTLLEQIRFSEADTLYLLGDLVDRGPEPIPLLQDILCRPNVCPFLGNHEYMMLTVLRRLSVEITPENAETHLTAADLTGYLHWTRDGGQVTARQFQRLGREEQLELLDFLEEFSLYEEVSVGGKRYILTHAGLHHFRPDRPLEDYGLEDFLFHRPDYSRRYFPDQATFLVTGHTPTQSIHQDKQPLIYREQGHIALDCGCVYGGRLAALCLESGAEFYVERQS